MEVKNHFIMQKPANDFLSSVVDEYFYLDINASELSMKNEHIIPPIRMKIFKMNKLEGITQKEIAIKLNIPLRTVEHHIS